MRILFDQGVPAPLRRHLIHQEVDTASERGWASLTDRELLDRAESHGFDLLITTDRNLKYQQDLSSRELAILVLCTTSWPRIRKRTTQIAQAADEISPGDYLELPIP